MSRAETLTLLAVLVALCAAIDTGHQLTPIFALATVAVLALVGRTRLVAWPGVMILLMLGWICYGAVAYWSGHFSTLFGGIGNVSGNFSTDLRLHGSVDHYRVDDIRLLMFGGLWLLATIGFFVGRKTLTDRRAAAVLMLTPLVVITGQAYGGEAGLRAFLFSLPGAICLAALALAPALKFTRIVVTAVVIALLVPGFLIARWGNELSEEELPGEIEAIRVLYARAETGSTIMSITPEVAWEFEAVGRYRYAPNNLDEFAFGRVASIVAQIKNPRGGYVVITRSQIVYAEQAYGLPDNWGTTVAKRLIRSHQFRLIYRNPTSSIYQYVAPSP
jgi:hypothetical protein